ncbi:hypothetical protein OIU77_014853 [Salix suchowensis]|uniref:Uncharacterized protein n=1 Tax=Salix suchowensis TaxID=1278906 RepID=A0ABQ8ZZN1_9ROSI|nr:hypothetical protein OIU77_014853 [Salix suchowensis]
MGFIKQSIQFSMAINARVKAI